jgi:hypothetical protein
LSEQAEHFSSRISQQEAHAVKHESRLEQHESEVQAVKTTLEEIAPTPAAPEVPRQLLSAMTVGTTATSGCLAVADADTTYTTSSADCVSAGVRCPQCFIATTLTADRTYTIAGCSTARIGSAAISGTQVLEYLFINIDTAEAMTIRSGTTTSYNEYKLGPLQQVHATCYTGGSDQLYFESNYGGDVYDTANTARRAICPAGCNTAQPYRSDTLGTFGVYMAPASLTCTSTAHTAAAGAISIGTADTVAACTANDNCATKADSLGSNTAFTYTIEGTVSNICVDSR